MVNKKAFILLFILILLLPIAYSLTAAIGNARAFVKVNASPEEPAVLKRTILVQNRNEIAVKVSLKVSKEFEKFVDIIDKELILEPDESKKARYTLTLDRGGHFEIKINVAFEPADPTIKENKVGMSSTLIISSEGPIIEEPEEKEEDKPAEKPEKNEPEEKRENPFFQTETPEFNKEELENKEIETKEESAPLALGILVIIVIIGIGIAIFFIIQKLR